MENNKVAFITGCKGELGTMIMKKLISKNYKVICHIRKKDKKFFNFTKKFKKNIIQIICFDLLNKDDLVKQIEKLSKNINRIDLLIINAGSSYGGLFEMSKIEDIKKIYEVNFFSQILIIQKLLKLLKKTKKSLIINISSISSLIPLRGNIAYGGSKLLLNFFTKILSKELKVYDIRVNALAPTVLKNKMGKKTDLQTSKFLLKKSLGKKPLNMKKVVDKIIFLISDKAKTINGRVIKIDK